MELLRFFELSLDLFGIANLEGYFLRINSNFSRLLGYAESEILTRPFLDFVHPDDRAATVSAMAKLSSGLPVVQFRNRYLDVRGEFHWFEWTARSVPEEGRIYAVARDVTEARLAEAQRIARVGSWEWRIERNQIWWSDEYYRILGLLPGEAPAGPETFFQRAHPDDVELIKNWSEAALQNGGSPSLEFRIIRPDGSERVIWAEARLERDAEGKPTRFVGTCQDITGRRRAMEEKQMIEKKIQESQKLESLGVLAGGIAHDFNNLLTAILGNASVIQMKLPANSPLRPALDNILQASDRAASLCRQMLAYSGRGRFVLSQVDLNRMVVEMIDLLKTSISKKAELKLDLAESLPTVYADATQIGQVVMNLVINASESLGDLAGTIRIVTGVGRTDGMGPRRNTLPGPSVFVEVTDTGAGMDDETRRKIFEPFFTTKFTGRGLGLSAVLGIVRGHRGAIDVESALGAGSTFRLYLPTDSGPSSTAAPTKSVAAATIAPSVIRSEGTVLVADDDLLVRETTVRMLRAMDFRVVEAEDGEDALARFRESPDAFCLVLLDLTMPKLDGDEVFRTLSALRPRLPVILMSGYSEEEAFDRFAGAGLAGFLAKPFEFEDLIHAVKSALHLS